MATGRKHLARAYLVLLALLSSVSDAPSESVDKTASEERGRGISLVGRRETDKDFTVTTTIRGNGDTVFDNNGAPAAPTMEVPQIVINRLDHRGRSHASRSPNDWFDQQLRRHQHLPRSGQQPCPALRRLHFHEQQRGAGLRHRAIECHRLCRAVHGQRLVPRQLQSFQSLHKFSRR